MKGGNPAFRPEGPHAQGPHPPPKLFNFYTVALKKKNIFSESILAYSGLTLPSTMEGITHGGAHPIRVFGLGRDTEE